MREYELRTLKPLLLILLAGMLAVVSAGAAPNTARIGDWQKIMGISRQAIANPAWLETPEWKEFTTEMGQLAASEADDETFRATFNERARALPFSHYQLLRTDRGSGTTSPALELHQPAPETTVLVVRRFEESPAGMHEIVQQLRTSPPANLILDLRQLGGGAFPSAVALGRHLNREPVDTGVYLSRRWFAMHGGYPDRAALSAIEPLETLGLDAFRERLRTTGILRLVLPAHDDPIFGGRLLILTSRSTASAGEPFVHSLRRRPDVTVIGERTAGEMLSGERFPINANWQLFAPVADYMTAEGDRLDRVGVAPHIEVPAAAALERALELIAESAPAGS